MKLINIYSNKSEYSNAQIREEGIRFPNKINNNTVDAIVSCNEENYKLLMNMFPPPDYVVGYQRNNHTRKISDADFALVILMFNIQEC